MKTRLTVEELGKAHGGMCGVFIGDGACSCLVHWVEALQKEADAANLQIDEYRKALRFCAGFQGSCPEGSRVAQAALDVTEKTKCEHLWSGGKMVCSHCGAVEDRYTTDKRNHEGGAKC